MPKISITLGSILLIPAVIFDPSGELTATVISAALHELGHLIMIAVCGVGMRELRITPYGLEIETARRYGGFAEELAITAAGCVINLICFFLLSPLQGIWHSVAYASLILGIINAMPVLSLDGGEALFCVLCSILPYGAACRISRAVSFVTLTAMWVLAAYIFLFSGYNYSLFIMTVWLFAKIYCK